MANGDLTGQEMLDLGRQQRRDIRQRRRDLRSGQAGQLTRPQRQRFRDELREARQLRRAGKRQRGFEEELGRVGLQGVDERQARLLGLSEQLGSRGAPGLDVSGFRAGQADLVGQLQAQAAGRGPSLAQAQLEEALGRNIAGQAALAQSGRPGQQALAARQASQQAGQLGAQFGQQAAQARMAEQAIDMESRQAPTRRSCGS